MAASETHFEVFARRSSGGFNMEVLLHDRDRALAAAEEMFAGGEFIAVRVTREALDPESGEFRSTTLLRKGPQEEAKARALAEDPGPPCEAPADLYLAPARAVIGRLLEGWLAKTGVTPFELLHRPDLARRLEAATGDLQHALQKAAVPQALARGVGVHETLRALQKLSQTSINRILTDEREGRFATVAPESFDGLCRRLAAAPDRLYLLGASVAGYIAPAASWNDKVARLLDLVEAAPDAGPPREFALQALAQLLGEILETPAALTELLGPDLDLGGRLAAMTRLTARNTLAVLVRVDPTLGALVPTLSEAALRLAKRLNDPGFDPLLRGLHARLLTDLASARRLRPADALAEIEILRVLSLALTSAAGDGPLAIPVRDALTARGKALVGADFVTAYLGQGRPAAQEVFDLARLLETVTGESNRRQAIRWLDSAIASLRFETEMTGGGEPPALRLAHLARLYRQAQRGGRDVAGLDTLLEKIGGLGDRVEAESRLVKLVARKEAPLVQKLDALLKMAMGETVPPGPAAERARTEAKKLIASPAASAELASAPQTAAQVRSLMKAFEAAAA
jgi:hypothetical protein